MDIPWISAPESRKCGRWRVDWVLHVLFYCFPPFPMALAVSSLKGVPSCWDPAIGRKEERRRSYAGLLSLPPLQSLPSLSQAHDAARPTLRSRRRRGLAL